VAAIDQTGPARFSARREYTEEHLAGHRVARCDDPGAWNPLCKLLRARGVVGDDEFGFLSIHREAATDDDLARQVACLAQHVVDPGPVYGEQDDVRLLPRLMRGASPRI